MAARKRVAAPAPARRARIQNNPAEYKKADATESKSTAEPVLGRKAEIPADPVNAPLDIVVWKNKPNGERQIVRLTCPEFTALCPVTGQPDFGTIVIEYTPHNSLIESKSLKLFLASFRNVGIFHEEAVQLIGRRLWTVLGEPNLVRVSGFFRARGGITIDAFFIQGSSSYLSSIPPLERPR